MPTKYSPHKMPKDTSVRDGTSMIQLSAAYFVVHSAAEACLVPFLPYFCRQLGLSALQVGIIFSTKTLFAAILSPLWCFFATKFEKQKVVFLLCALGTIVFTVLLIFVPPVSKRIQYLDCFEQEDESSFNTNLLVPSASPPVTESYISEISTSKVYRPTTSTQHSTSKISNTYKPNDLQGVRFSYNNNEQDANENDQVTSTKDSEIFHFSTGDNVAEDMFTNGNEALDTANDYQFASKSNYESKPYPKEPSGEINRGLIDEEDTSESENNDFDDDSQEDEGYGWDADTFDYEDKTEDDEDETEDDEDETDDDEDETEDNEDGDNGDVNVRERSFAEEPGGSGPRLIGQKSNMNHKNGLGTGKRFDNSGDETTTLNTGVVRSDKSSVTKQIPQDTYKPLSSNKHKKSQSNRNNFDEKGDLTHQDISEGQQVQGQQVKNGNEGERVRGKEGQTTRVSDIKVKDRANPDLKGTDEMEEESYILDDNVFSRNSGPSHSREGNENTYNLANQHLQSQGKGEVNRDHSKAELEDLDRRMQSEKVTSSRTRSARFPVEYIKGHNSDKSKYDMNAIQNALNRAAVIRNKRDFSEDGENTGDYVSVSPISEVDVSKTKNHVSDIPTNRGYNDHSNSLHESSQHTGSSTFALVLVFIVMAAVTSSPGPRLIKNSLYHYLDHEDEMEKYSLAMVPSFAACSVVVITITIVIGSLPCQVLLVQKPMNFHIYVFVFLMLLSGAVSVCMPLFTSYSSHSTTKMRKALALLCADSYTSVLTLSCVLQGIFSSTSSLFLFWMVQDLGGGEIPMGVFVALMSTSQLLMTLCSTEIVRKISFLGGICVSFICLSISNVLYFVAWNSWLVVPIGILAGLIHQLFWEAIFDYLEQTAPPGISRKMLTHLQTINLAVGVMCGNLTSGYFYDVLGLKFLFLIMGGVSLVWTGVLIFVSRSCPHRDSLHYSKLFQSKNETESEDDYAEDWLMEALAEEEC